MYVLSIVYKLEEYFGRKIIVKLVKVCRSSMVSVLTSSQQPWGQFWGVPQGSILIPPVFQAKAGMHQGQPYSVSSPAEWNSFPADSFITT